MFWVLVLSYRANWKSQKWQKIANLAESKAVLLWCGFCNRWLWFLVWKSFFWYVFFTFRRVWRFHWIDLALKSPTKEFGAATQNGEPTSLTITHQWRLIQYSKSIIWNGSKKLWFQQESKVWKYLGKTFTK